MVTRFGSRFVSCFRSTQIDPDRPKSSIYMLGSGTCVYGSGICACLDQAHNCPVASSAAPILKIKMKNCESVYFDRGFNKILMRGRAVWAWGPYGPWTVPSGSRCLSLIHISEPTRPY